MCVPVGHVARLNECYESSEILLISSGKAWTHLKCCHCSTCILWHKNWLSDTALET